MQVDLLRVTLLDFESAKSIPSLVATQRTSQAVLVAVTWQAAGDRSEYRHSKVFGQTIIPPFSLNLARRETTMNAFKCVLRNVCNNEVLFEADWLFLEAFSKL